MDRGETSLVSHTASLGDYFLSRSYFPNEGGHCKLCKKIAATFVSWHVDFVGLSCCTFKSLKMKHEKSKDFVAADLLSSFSWGVEWSEGSRSYKVSWTGCSNSWEGVSTARVE